MASSTPPVPVSRSGVVNPEGAVSVASMPSPHPHPQPQQQPTHPHQHASQQHLPAQINRVVSAQPPLPNPTIITMPPASSASLSVAPASFTVYQTTNLDPSHPEYQSPAAAVLAAAAPPPPGALNPRSCVTCRRRKVRCDKHMPCGNCLRTKVACVFPAPGRAPRKLRPRDPNAPLPKPSSQRELELRQRLRKLEGIVEELSGQLEPEPATKGNTPGSSGKPATGDKDRPSDAGSPLDRTPLSRASTMSPKATDRMSFDHRMSVDTRPSTSGEDARHFGRLVMHEKGKTRYVSGGFWAKLNDELEEIRRATEMLDVEDSEEEDDMSSPLSPGTAAGRSDHHAFVLGFASTDVDLQPFHPSRSLIPFIWKTYLDNVEIWIKLLHAPTVEKVLNDMAGGQPLEAGHEALVFAIYYATVTSLDDDEVEASFGTPKEMLITQYRFALEQALAKAQFLTTSDFVVLQAFVLFLIIVRRYDDTRFCWSLSCIAIRVAQGMGLHRDGIHFDLSPFETEMRRRLWWNICILDLRSAEGLGTDLTIREDSFDTPLPTNINDADITPDDTELPTPRIGHSDCAAAMTRWSMLKFSRRLQAYTSLAPLGGRRPADSMTEEERERDIQEMADHLEHSYLTDCDPDSHPAYWVAAIIARIIQCKLVMVVHQNALESSEGTADHEEIRDRVFRAAYQIIVYSQIVFTDPRIRQWQWLFLTYTQWHAIAFTLMEAQQRPWSAILELWWEALYATLRKSQAFHVLEPTAASNGSSIVDRSDHSAVWLPLQTLFGRVRKYRSAELVRFKSDPKEARRMDAINEEQMRTLFIPLHGVQERLDGARARWRALVGIGPAASPPQMGGGDGPSPPAQFKREVSLDSDMSEDMIMHVQQLKQGQLQSSIQTMNTVIQQASYTPLDLYNMAAWNSPQQQAPAMAPLQTPVTHPHTTMSSPPVPVSQPMHHPHQHPMHQPMAATFHHQPQPQPQPPPQPHMHPQQHPHQQGSPAIMVGNTMGLTQKDSWLWAQQGFDPQQDVAAATMGQGEITMDFDGFDWYDWHRRIGGLQMGVRK